MDGSHISRLALACGSCEVRELWLPRHVMSDEPERTSMSNNCIVVAGAGGFIGGHLIADLLRRGATNVRAIDIKPLDDWYQVFPEVDNVVADVRRWECCQRACQGASEVYNLAADMGGMGFIENPRIERVDDDQRVGQHRRRDCEN